MKKNITIIAILFSMLLFTGKAFSQAAPGNPTPADGEYRSNGAVNFTTATNWQIASGGVWGAASSAPDGTKTITIQNGNACSVNTALVVTGYIQNQNTTIAGVSASITNTSTAVTLAAASTSIAVGQVVSGTGIPTSTTVVAVSGTSVTLSAAATATNAAASLTFTGISFSLGTGSLTFNSGSTYEHAGNGGTVPASTWSIGSTCLVTGVTANAPSGLTQALYNLTWNCPSQSTNLNFGWATGYTLAGSLSVLNSNANQMRFASTSAGTTVTMTISGGITVNGATAFLSGTGSGAGPSSFLVINVGGDITLSAGTLSLTNSSNTQTTLNLSGNLIMSGGTLTKGSPTSTLAFAKTGAQSFTKTGGTIAGNLALTVNSGSTLTIADGSTANTGIVTIPSGTTFTVASGGALNVAPNATLGVASGGTLALGGQLVTIQSTSVGTGALGTLSGTVTGATNVTIQRYIPGGRRAFRFFSHPFSTAIALNQMTATSTEIDITGSGGSTSGFTTTGTNNPSAFWYDPSQPNAGTVTTISSGSSGATDPGWIPFSSDTATTTGSNSWNQYQGIRVLVRGIKGEGLTSSTGYTPSAATISMNGSINIGDKTVTLASTAGYNLVGNPYPSQVDLKNTSPTLTQNNIFIFNANQGTKGGYTSFAIYGGSAASYVLPVGGAFVIQSTSTASSIAFTEASSKVTSTPTSLFRTNTNSFSSIELKLESGSIFWDRLLVNYDKDAKITRDNIDAEKFANSDVNFYSLSSDKQALSIDARPIGSTEPIALAIQTAQSRTFTLTVANFDIPADMEIWLHDKYLNTWQQLQLGSTYDFEVTADAASQGEDRLELVQKAITSLTIATNFTIKVSPNPATDVVTINFNNAQKQSTSISLTSATGQKVKSVDAGNVQSGTVTIDVKGLARGLYYISLNGKDTQKLVVE